MANGSKVKAPGQLALSPGLSILDEPCASGEVQSAGLGFPALKDFEPFLVDGRIALNDQVLVGERFDFPDQRSIL